MREQESAAKKKAAAKPLRQRRTGFEVVKDMIKTNSSRVEDTVRRVEGNAAFIFHNYILLSYMYIPQ